MDLGSIVAHLWPVVYLGLGAAVSESMRLMVGAFNQRIQDKDVYRKKRAEEATSIQLRRIDDAAEWRRQQEMRITALDTEVEAKDKRIDDLVDQNAQLRAENIALVRELAFYKERYTTVALELNELKYPKKRQE